MEKSEGIFFKATKRQKEQIAKNAKLCGLPKGEYICKRALGYTPKPVQPDEFYLFYQKLCELINGSISPETEKAALKLFDDISSEFISDKKQVPDEIKAEVEGDSEWQP